MSGASRVTAAATTTWLLFSENYSTRPASIRNQPAMTGTTRPGLSNTSSRPRKPSTTEKKAAEVTPVMISTR